MIVGHRGAAALAPENTLAGINKAADLGIHGIEIDVQLTADGIPVIIHDETIDRCTNGSGELASLTLKQLKQFDAGSWFDAAFFNEKVPTLEEVLALCLERKLSINLELKIHHENQVALLVENVATAIKSSGFSFDQLLLSSFSMGAVEACRRLLPGIRRGYLSEDKCFDYLKEIEYLDLYSVNVNQEILTAEMAKAITDRGYVINIWTLNDPNKQAQFKRWKVNDIITDNPLLFNRK